MASTSSQASPTPKASLLSLPNEIIALVLAELDPERDVWSLREATSQLHEHIIQSLHGRHVDTDHTLFWCCQAGYKEGLLHILKRKPNLNRRIAVATGWFYGDEDRWSTSYKQTPLALAAGNGHKDIVEILLRNGAQVECVTRNVCEGSASIPLAACKGYHEITRLLFAHTSPEACTQRAEQAGTALHALTNPFPSHYWNHEGKRSAKTDVDRTATVRVLLKEGADVRAQNSHGRTYLHHLAESPFTHGDLDLRMFLDLGLDPNLKDDLGEKPLHIAAAQPWQGLSTCYYIALLVQFGADVNSQDNRGQTPLHLAMRQDWITRVWRWSAGHGSDLLEKARRQDHDEKSPLRIALRKLHGDRGLGIAELLIDLGANVNCQDAVGNTPLHAIMDTAWKRSKSVPAADMKLLIDHGADVNIRNREGESPIDAPVVKMREVLKRLVSLKQLLDLMKAVVWMRICLSKMKSHK